MRGRDECGIESGAVASSDNTGWNGPGVSPAPGPPGPPHHGPCDAPTKAECKATIDPEGKHCTWCFLSGIGVGICQSSPKC